MRYSAIWQQGALMNPGDVQSLHGLHSPYRVKARFSLNPTLINFSGTLNSKLQFPHTCRGLDRALLKQTKLSFLTTATVVALYYNKGCDIIILYLIILYL